MACPGSSMWISMGKHRMLQAYTFTQIYFLTGILSLLLNWKIAHVRSGTKVVTYNSSRNAQALAASSGSAANIPARREIIASILYFCRWSARVSETQEADASSRNPRHPLGLRSL